VQEVRHRGLVERSVAAHELVAHAQERDAFVPRHLRKGLIHLQHESAQRIHPLATRWKVEHDHARLGALLQQRVHHRAHGAHDQFAAVSPGARVVRPDHQHDHFGIERGQRRLLQPPQHMLGAVAAHADLQRTHGFEVPRPCRGAGVLPALGDAVAQEHHAHRILRLSHAPKHLVLASACAIRAWHGHHARRQHHGVACGRSGCGGRLSRRGGWRGRGLCVHREQDWNKPLHHEVLIAERRRALGVSRGAGKATEAGVEPAASA